MMAVSRAALLVGAMVGCLVDQTAVAKVEWMDALSAASWVAKMAAYSDGVTVVTMAAPRVSLMAVMTADCWADATVVS
jgi:hypothetical protein